MKNCIRTLLLVVFACAHLQAQNTEFKNALHAKVNLIDYRIFNDEDFKPGQGFELGLYRNFSNYLNVGVPVKVGLAPVPGKTVNSLIGSGDVLVHLGDFRPSVRLSPYIFGGLGLVKLANEDPSLQIPVGGGAHLRLSQYAFLNLQGEFRKSTVEKRNNLQIGLGYVYLLHKAEVVPTPLPEPAMPDEKTDTDADGTPDILDHCPNQSGPAIALGCPDTDLDSIADFEDRCPDLAGSLATQGCPDKDGDGVVDLDDKCPDEIGTVRGCPDTDKDGFSDKDDQCPDMAGRWNGCPDADFDGVPDKEDKCPTDPGSPENGGCPANKKDTDGDGFPDDLDKCPNAAGTLAGCPDTDGDGFSDEVDKCPKDKGALAGCPDTDGDGFADKDDPCPTSKGVEGPCPTTDLDGDGITDDKDKCPNLAAAGTANGCPEVKAEVKQRLEFAKRAVQFETGRATLKGSSYQILDEIYRIMLDYQEYKLVISGHTDDIGDDSRNLALSTERAKACHDYFLFKGIAQSRLRYLGFGEFKPIAENTTSEGRELNRRVEFEVAFE
jgi:OmpA-OmpF porin, OOP family